ncbi:MAG: hypothetical protein QNJ38_21635 [Prochloraceae cyanobacterium]|nr:hypothetical protein [Prochloraceae cyanobacterium]
MFSKQDKIGDRISNNYGDRRSLRRDLCSISKKAIATNWREDKCILL